MRFLTPPRLALLLIFCAALFIRSYHLRDRLNFSTDQGVFGLQAYKIWREKTFTLLGPRTSFEYEGRVIFQGSIIYYMMLAFLLPAGFDPVVGTALYILFACLMIFPLYSGVRRLSTSAIAILISSVYAFVPYYVIFTSFFWNPNFQLSLLPLAICALAWHKAKQRNSSLFVVGVMFGGLLLFHYQGVLLIGITFLYLLCTKQITLRQIPIYGVGLAIGFLPTILFELRNGLYLTKTVLLFVGNLDTVLHQSGGGTAAYYVLSVSFLLLILISSLFKIKISLRSSYILAILLGIFGLVWMFPRASQAFSLPTGWSMSHEERVATIIEAQHLDNFAVANTLYDTTAAVQYYLLTVRGVPGISSNYYTNSYLFIISRDDAFASNPAYEVNQFSSEDVIREWELDSSYKLYLLKRPS